MLAGVLRNNLVVASEQDPRRDAAQLAGSNLDIHTSLAQSASVSDVSKERA